MKTEQLRLYAASPLGFSEAGRDFYYAKFIPVIVEAGYSVLDPWKLTDQKLIDEVLKKPLGPEQVEGWQKLNRVIGKNNAIGIMHSDMVGACLDGTDVDSGTASEIGFATGLGKPSAGYRGDFRLSADNVGATVNLQVEYFIQMYGGSIARNPDDFYDILVTMRPKILKMQRH